MPRDGERQLGLPLAGIFDADLDQRAGVQNCRERGDPGLVVMLRAEERQHRIRKMALHEFGGPKLPVLEEVTQRLVASRVSVAPKQLARSGGRARTRIQQRNIYLALRERTVDEWQVANNGGKKTKPKAPFGDYQRTRQRRVRDDIAESQREKCRAAEIQIGHKAGLRSGHDHGRAGTILHQPKTENESHGPHANQNQQRDRAEEAQQRLAALPRRYEPNDELPGGPRRFVKQASEPESAGDASWKDDGLERVPNDDQKDRDTRGESARSWNHVRHCTCSAGSKRMCEVSAQSIRIRGARCRWKSCPCHPSNHPASLPMPCAACFSPFAYFVRFVIREFDSPTGRKGTFTN